MFSKSAGLSEAQRTKLSQKLHGCTFSPARPGGGTAPMKLPANAVERAVERLAGDEQRKARVVRRHREEELAVEKVQRQCTFMPVAADGHRVRKRLPKQKQQRTFSRLYDDAARLRAVKKAAAADAAFRKRRMCTFKPQMHHGRKDAAGARRVRRVAAKRAKARELERTREAEKGLSARQKRLAEHRKRDADMRASGGGRGSSSTSKIARSASSSSNTRATSSPAKSKARAKATGESASASRRRAAAAVAARRNIGVGAAAGDDVLGDLDVEDLEAEGYGPGEDPYGDDGEGPSDEEPPAEDDDDDEGPPDGTPPLAGSATVPGWMTVGAVADEAGLDDLDLEALDLEEEESPAEENPDDEALDDIHASDSDASPPPGPHPDDLDDEDDGPPPSGGAADAAAAADWDGLADEIDDDDSGY